MTSFVTLYRGETVGDARIVAVSADPDLVALVAAALLGEYPQGGEDDPVLRALHAGRREALRAVIGATPGGRRVRYATGHRPTTG